MTKSTTVPKSSVITKDDIIQGVKEVISQDSRYEVKEIQLSDPLDKFISSFMADRLARDLGRKFDRIDTTQLTNDLYTSLKKVGDVVDRIATYYPSKP